jgi:hypothetical protein
MVEMNPNNMIGATFSYDINGNKDKNIKSNIEVMGDETQWFFVYAGYSHHAHRVTFFFKFADREEQFSIPARHFFSKYHSLILGNDQWNNGFNGAMRNWSVSFC